MMPYFINNDYTNGIFAGIYGIKNYIIPLSMSNIIFEWFYYIMIWCILLIGVFHTLRPYVSYFGVKLIYWILIPFALLIDFIRYGKNTDEPE